MTPQGPSLAPETLLAHAGWMRRLARTLVRDDAQADDVVQDAVVAAMRAPPRDVVALPAWLATSVKNGARQLWRGESRRAARETLAARHEAAPSAAEVVARAEEHGLVVQAVLALEEPYRSTLLLRFYDDLPPRDVAKRTGVPVETARARIRRGVEQLRERLDSAHGGDGAAWRLALVPFIVHKTAATVGAGTGAAAGHQLTTGAIVMAGSGTAVVGGLALVVGVAAGWWFGATSSDKIAAEHVKSIEAEKKQVETLRSDVAQRDEHVKRQTGQISTLETAVRAAQKEASDLKKQLDEKTAALEEAKTAASKATLVASAPASKAATGPRFAFDQYGKLADVDWKSVGEHLSAMSPLIEEISGAIAKGADYMDAQGRAAQHNGYLINAAVKVVGQVPGTGVNGAFTHPSFMANAIAAALEAAGKPLSADQSTAMERAARESSDEDVRRLQSYPDGTFTMKKTLDEGDLRKRFFDAAFKILTEAQRTTLTPAGTKGIVGLDIYSEGLLWATLLNPVPFKDTAGLVDAVSHTVQSRLHLPADRTDAVKAVVANWARDLPAPLVDPASDLRAKAGVIHVETLRMAVVQTLTLMQSLVADLKLDGAPSDAAHRWAGILLTMPSAE